MRNRSCGARAGVAAALAVWACAAETIEVGEQEAISRSLSRPAYLEVEAGRVAAARGGVVDAGRIPNPVVTFEQERVPAAGGRATERLISVAQTIDLSGRRGLRVEAAERRGDAAHQEILDRRLQAIAEVRRGFAEALHAERQQQALTAWLKRIEAGSKTIGHLAKSGEVSGYAKRRIEREVQAARARLASGTGDEARVRERLRGLIGIESGSELRLAGELMPDELPPLAAAMTSLRARPDLAALVAQAEAFDRERALAERAWAPDLTVGLGQKTVSEPLRNDTGVMFSLAFPLALFDRGEGRRDTALGQARALRGEHALLLARAEAELRGVWQQASELRSGAIALRAAPVTDLSRTAETAYRAGEGGIVELLDAYRSELDAELGLMDLERRARNARIELDTLAGADRAK